LESAPSFSLLFYGSTLTTRHDSDSDDDDDGDGHQKNWCIIKLINLENCTTCNEFMIQLVVAAAGIHYAIPFHNMMQQQNDSD